MSVLERRISTGLAVGIGLASMVGAGVFYVWAPAAAAAGGALLVGLVIAGIVASLNALSTAQLAMAHPVSGGAYAFGRATIGPWTGFTAGWLFVWGKTASAGAIALIAGSYLWPAQARAVAVGVIVVLAAVNATGIRSTARVSVAIVTIVGIGLVALLGATLISGAADGPVLDLGQTDAGFYGVLQSAGLLFFCFAGYARMATLGEEVRDPQRTLPRAIIMALAIALVLYSVVGALCLSVLGVDGLASSTSPLADLASAALGGAAWPVVATVVAAIASLGSLIGILAGLSRTSLAMAREGDLPGGLSRISTRTSAPVVAEASVALVAILAVVLLDPRQLVGFSACAVLGYYAIAHAAALRQPRSERWLPRAVQWIGLAGCILLAFTLPWQAIVGAVAVLAVGLLARAVTGRLARPSASG
ncbi:MULTISPECIES: APC family permease [unclassified Leifsonia]|uniref:APC family permease n=1 Tax=unclassified Leifsonia TaxID=2663824 RepID=UPI001F3D3368|nr:MULTISPECIES: APC family permease [unclassified Leifsonia]